MKERLTTQLTLISSLLSKGSWVMFSVFTISTCDGEGGAEEGLFDSDSADVEVLLDPNMLPRLNEIPDDPFVSSDFSSFFSLSSDSFLPFLLLLFLFLSRAVRHIKIINGLKKKNNSKNNSKLFLYKMFQFI